MKIRDATPADAQAMSDVLEEIFEAGKRSSGGNVAMVMARYIEDPDRVRCTLLEDDHARILGFQSLKVVREGNIYNAPAGWGVIGTHIRPSAARQGIGRRLFAITREAAVAAGLEHIEAQIGSDNEEGLAFYEALGFVTYRHDGQNICKAFEVNS